MTRWALLLVCAAGALLRLATLDRLPPGLWIDEAWEAVDAQAILAGARPVFLPANNGREPLFAYLLAGVFALAGATPEAVRLTSALVGIATLPATWLWARAWYGPRVGLLATAFLALLYWHVHESRLGLRSITLPLVTALALWLLKLALGGPARSGDRAGPPLDGRPWGHLAAAAGAGALLALAWYTYLPARLLPALVAVYLLLAWWQRSAPRPPSAERAPRAARGPLGVSERSRTSAFPDAPEPPARPGPAGAEPPAPRWRHSAGLVLLVAAFAVVLAPLARYFVAHPADFLSRGEQVSVLAAIRTGADPVEVIGNNVRLNLGQFFLLGDRQARHNLPGRPVFDPLSAALAGLGLGVAGARAWAARRGGSGGLPEYGTLLVWLPLMLVPGVVSDSAPHFLRSIGLLPGLVVLPALGLDALTRWLAGPPARLGPRGAASVAAAALLVVGTLTARDYFLVLAHHPDLAASFQVVNRALAERAARYPPEVAVFAGPVAADDPTVQFLAPREVRTFDETVLPLPDPARGPIVFLLAPSQESDFALLQRLRPGGRALREDGLLVYELAGRAAAPDPPAGEPLARFDGWLELLEVQAPTEVRANEWADFRLTWRAAAAPPGSYTVFLRLVAPDGRSAAELHSAPGRGSYPTSRWSAGELVLDRPRLPLPPDLLPGPYRVVLGLDRPDGSRAEARGPNGPAPAGELQVGATTARPARVPPSRGRLQIPNPADVPLTDPARGLEVARYWGGALSAGRVRAGDPLAVTLYWQSLRDDHPDYERVVRLVGPDGRAVAELAGPATGGMHPASRWTAGEVVREDLTLRVPRGLAAGRYVVQAELRADGVPLRPTQPSAALVVGAVEVEQRAVRREPPPLAEPVGARFGAVAELLGYDLEPAAPRAGAPLVLTLHWRALAETETSYTVFVHLVDAAGQIRAQRDAPPQEGALPTSLWVTGEVVSDRRALALDAALPPGEYALFVGLYDAATGARLPAFDAAGQRLPDDRLLLTRRRIGG